MKTKVRMWGNSLAVRIPKLCATDTGLEASSEIEVSVERGGLGLVLVRPKWNLKQLLASVKEDQLHGEEPWGLPVGREEW